MPEWVTPALLALLLPVLAAAAYLLGRAVRDRTGRGQADAALLLLKGEIEAARGEARQVQAETLATVRQELHHLRTELAGHVGQVGSGVQQQLSQVGQVVGQVQGKLGELGQAAQRIFDVGRDIAGLEQILKSPKVRGGLGETLLERLLAELLPREHYDLQHAFRSGDKVDAVIRLAGRLVPVDAKFPLENFRRMLEEPEEERRRALRKAFGRDAKNRIEEIAKKYILPDEGTFDFALMYIPSENVYYEMILTDEETEAESIAAYASSRHVVPVSPNSFFAYLQVIALGLRGLRIEAHAREIQGDLVGLANDLTRVREHFAKLGVHLANAQKQFTDAERDLARFGDKLEAIGRKGEPAALEPPA